MKVTYRGPGDAVELDGLRIKKGEIVEVTYEQYTRILGSDPDARVDVTSNKGDDDEDTQRIKQAQANARERGVRAAEREAETAAEADTAASRPVPLKRKES